ncbi:MAG: L,D-transpeptidase [bacterium]|nr:L,D-transpeptidase [bacterium]
MSRTALRRPVVVFMLLLTLLPAFGWSASASEDESIPAEEIAAYAPPITRLLTNESVLRTRDYRHIPVEVPIYDAPNGTRIATRPASDYWVSVERTVEGWAEINDGEWVPWGLFQRAPVSRLSGILLNAEAAYPVGWLRAITLVSSAPGLDPDPTQAAALDRYRVVNIFAQTTVDGAEWVQVGVEQWVPAANVAVVRPVARPTAVDSERWVGVDLAQQVLIAYEGERAVFAALISSGMAELPTHPGIFRVFHRQRVQTLGWGSPGELYSYTVEDVPHILYFNGDQGLHAAYWHDDFGTPRSHGCVNLSLTDAAWVYDFLSAEINFDDRDDAWPMVVVY